MEQLTTESTFSIDDVADKVFRNAGKQFNLSKEYIKMVIEDGLRVGKLREDDKFQKFYNHVVSGLGKGKPHMGELSNKPESEAGTYRASNHLGRKRNHRY